MVKFSDINECLSDLNNCHKDAICTNIKSSFYCTCKSGYKGKNGTNCTGSSHNKEKYILSHRYKCFTVKYATRRFRMKLHPGYEWHIFNILPSEDITDVIFFCFSSSFYFRNTHIYVIKWNLHVRLNIWSLSSRGKDFTSEHSERVKYFFHSKINFTCSRHRVISSLSIYIYYIKSSYN